MTPTGTGAIRGQSGLLRLIQFNCNGLKARNTELKAHLAHHKPDIVLLQETKLRENDRDPRYPGYNVAARQDGRQYDDQSTDGNNPGTQAPNTQRTQMQDQQPTPNADPPERRITGVMVEWTDTRWGEHNR